MSASSLRYNENRVAATYRDKDEASAARDEVLAKGQGRVTPLAEIGNKHVFGVDIAPGVTADALLDTFGQQGAGRDANKPHAIKAVLAADIKHAGQGLSDVTHDASAQTSDKFANIAARMSRTLGASL